MKLGRKVTFSGSRLWLHDETGRPAFGILRGDVPYLERAVSKPGERVELFGYETDVGHRHLRFEGDDLTALLELVPLLQEAAQAASTNE